MCNERTILQVFYFLIFFNWLIKTSHLFTHFQMSISCQEFCQMFLTVGMFTIFRSITKPTLKGNFIYLNKVLCNYYLISVLKFNSCILVTKNFSLEKMSDSKFEAVSNVEIDEGIFKYVLIKLYGKEKADGSEPFKLIVRGFNRAEWHCK